MTKVALLATAKIAAAPVYYKADILLTSAYRVLEWSRTPALFIHDEKHHEYHATGARDPGEGARPGGRSPHHVPGQAGPPGRPPEAGPGERVSRTPGAGAGVDRLSHPRGGPVLRLPVPERSLINAAEGNENLSTGNRTSSSFANRKERVSGSPVTGTGETPSLSSGTISLRATIPQTRTRGKSRRELRAPRRP